MMGNRLERAYQAAGILPLTPRDLHHLHPGPFPSLEAARGALKRCHSLGYDTVAYRLPHQRGYRVGADPAML